MKALKVSAICSIGFALLFAAFSLVFYLGDWPRFVFVFCTGLFVGLVAAPEFEPSAFKMAWLFQLGSGVAAGTLVALAYQADAETIGVAALLGGVLGWSAPFWAKHVQIP
jgi:hypothetical protein